MHDEQSHLVTGFSKSVSSLGLHCPVNMASSTSVKEKSCHWDRKETLLLIDLYRQNPCLWNVKSDVYKDRNKRVAAINEITAGMNRSGLSVTASEVRKKIESIRSQYRRELRKLGKSKKSGAGADDIYTPILWCFDDLCFLNDGDSMRESVSSMDSQVSHVPEEVSDHEVSTLLSYYLCVYLSYNEKTKKI